MQLKDTTARKRAERRAAVLKAMAHPSRLLVLEALEGGERCVQDLTALVGADISTVSRHLSLLKAAGLVGVRRQGAQLHHHLRCPCLMALFACLENVAGTGNVPAGARTSAGRRKTRTRTPHQTLP